MKTSLLITGTLTEQDQTGLTPPEKVVYQRVAKGHGNITMPNTFDLQRRRHVVPADPKTSAQLARRAAFAAAVASWHTATQEQREAVRPLADRRRISLFNAWISAHT